MGNENPDNDPAIVRLARYLLAQMIAYPDGDGEDSDNGSNEGHFFVQILDGLHDEIKIAEHYKVTMLQSMVTALNDLKSTEWAHGATMLDAFHEIIDARRASEEVENDEIEPITDAQFSAIEGAVKEFNDSSRDRVIISTSELANHLEGKT